MGAGKLHIIIPECYLSKYAQSIGVNKWLFQQRSAREKATSHYEKSYISPMVFLEESS